MQVVLKTVRVPDPVVNDESISDHFPTITKDFLLAGKARFVVANPQGRTYTFMIRGLKSAYRGKGQVSRYLRVMADTTTVDPLPFRFRYVGIVLETGVVKSTGQSEFLAGTPEYDVAQWAIRAVFDVEPLLPGYVIRHDNRCGRCGGPLTDDGVTDEALVSGLCCQ
jgi:hypothetical protein